MGFKTKRIKADQARSELTKKLVKNSGFVDGTSSTYISAGEIVAIDGIDGGYLTVDEAQAGTDQDMLYVALSEIREYGRIVDWYIHTMDTSTGAIGDPVFLDSATAGAVVLTEPADGAIVVGRVLSVDSSGSVLLAPQDPSIAGAETLIASGTLSSVQLTGLAAAPVTVIAAPGAGKVTEVLRAHFWLDHGGTDYVANAGDDLALRYTDGTGSQILVVDEDTFIDATGDAHRFAYPSTSPNAPAPVANAVVVADNNGAAEWTTGDGVLKYRIEYRIRDLEFSV